jgi:type IV secretion system protein VirB9
MAVATASPCWPQQLADTAPADPRIQTIAYDPDRVVMLRGTFGYQFMLEFGPGEQVETVAIGDGEGWQITPNKRADVLFVKPVERQAATNLTVLTNLHRYMFDLQVAGEKTRDAPLYIARFSYPEPPPPPITSAAAQQPEPEPVASFTDYRMSGAAELQPLRIFDDGVSTYFEWVDTASIPAIFASDVNGRESLVNYVVRGRYVVVDQISDRFVLKTGKREADVARGGAKKKRTTMKPPSKIRP